MRKSAIGAAAGALLVTAALASSAGAHPNTYTISAAGSTAAGNHPFYAVAGAGVDFKVDNGATVVDMGCDQVEAEGNVHSGTGVDVIGTIQAVTRANTPETFSHTNWKGCVGPFNTPMTVVPLNNWEIHGNAAATSGTTDVVSGYVSGPSNGPLRAQVYATAGGPTGTSCNFVVQGKANGSFSEAAQQLTVSETGFSGNLTVVSVQGGVANCLGQVPVGSPADFTGVFTLGADNAANTKASITAFLPAYLS